MKSRFLRHCFHMSKESMEELYKAAYRYKNCYSMSAIARTALMIGLIAIKEHPELIKSDLDKLKIVIDGK